MGARQRSDGGPQQRRGPLEHSLSTQGVNGRWRRHLALEALQANTGEQALEHQFAIIRGHMFSRLGGAGLERGERPVQARAPRRLDP